MSLCSCVFIHVLLTAHCPRLVSAPAVPLIATILFVPTAVSSLTGREKPMVRSNNDPTGAAAPSFLYLALFIKWPTIAMMTTASLALHADYPFDLVLIEVHSGRRGGFWLSNRKRKKALSISAMLRFLLF